MAFVYRSSKFPKAARDRSVPGPGSYTLEQNVCAKSPYSLQLMHRAKASFVSGTRRVVAVNSSASPGRRRQRLGPGQYSQQEQFKAAARYEDTEAKSLSINTQEYGVLVLLKPTPIGFNSRAERFKKPLERRCLPGTTL